MNKLKAAYVSELRESKRAADAWWSDLAKAYREKPSGLPPKELWPMGPASHPWVIATYRKYYFLALELKERTEHADATAAPEEADWGLHEAPEALVTWVEPKVFVLDLLSGGDTRELYEFLLALVFVPIGLKADEPV